jgi:exopolysaccharide biosynthesis polyprenyl glycosylphosphotransferase
MYEAITGQVRIETIRGLPLLNINPDIITEYQLFIKRSGDIFLAITALILFFPFYLLIALLVRMSSSGTILYKQVRVGLNGETFVLIKFRTMFDDSERTTGPIWAEEDDPRITPIGKILRKYHFDEIPQLLNVLWGNMSIIGPRPERPKIIEELVRDIPYYPRRLKVKPGITGWAQIMGAYDRSIGDVHNKLKHDFYYIENMSILLDLKIIFMTLWAVLRGGGN